METGKKTMLDYIRATPAALRANAADAAALAGPLAEEYLRGGYENLWIVACGSSANAAWCARPFLRRVLRREVKIVPPFTFAVCEHDFSPRDMVLVVSQSGYSLNALEAAACIRAEGRPVTALTADPGSDLARAADLAVDYGGGLETVGYVTRGMTTLVEFFMLFGLEAARRRGTLSAPEAEARLAALRRAADANEAAIEDWAVFASAHRPALTELRCAFVCGVGANYGTALEGALKLSETVSVPALGCETEEFIHGPNLQLTPDHSVFLLDGGAGSARTRQIFDAVRTVTDKAFLLTADPTAKGEGVFALRETLPEELTPFGLLPPLQMTAWRLAEELGRWEKHPLQRQMERRLSSKSENYAASALNRDTPGRR